MLQLNQLRIYQAKKHFMTCQIFNLQFEQISENEKKYIQDFMALLITKYSFLFYCSVMTNQLLV